MSGGHGHGLYIDGASPVHRLAPECKVAAAALFVLAVVATPREAFWAFAVHAAVVVGVAVVAGLSPPRLVRRLTVEIPFVAFALLLPFVAEGERVEVLGVGLSVGGLWAAWNVLAKATIGVAAALVLAATTDVPALLRGLERLRVPTAFTAVAGFMVRYADVVTGELRRMTVARRSRAHQPALGWRLRAAGGTAGALFVRSYERGERVHLAMQSRGWTGSMPVLADDPAGGGQWRAALSIPAVAAVVAGLAWIGSVA